MERYRKFMAALAAVAVIAVLAVCGNTPTTSGDYVYEGKQYLADGEYTDAITAFENAIEDDPLDADALYLHAKATLLKNDLSLLDCMDLVNSVQNAADDPLALLDLVDEDNWELMNTLYAVNRTVTADLKPIFNERTHGFYDKHDIMLDYLIASTVKSVLGLLDIFPPLGEIDKPWDSGLPDLGISFENGEVTFDTTALESLAAKVMNDPGMFNETIDQLVGNLEESQEVIGSLVGEELDVEVDDAAMDSSVTEMLGAIDQYRITPGIDDDGDYVETSGNAALDPMVWSDQNGDGFVTDLLGNTINATRVANESLSAPNGEWLSGDWGVDEEILDGKDNDGDGSADEDFSLIHNN